MNFIDLERRFHVLTDAELEDIGQDFHWDLAWRIPFTYCVPFLVAAWSTLGNARVTGTRG